MKSDSVPYLMSNVIGSNYKEDNGRIQLGEFPVQFELTQNTNNCQLGHGTYKITTLFKFDRPTYKNKEVLDIQSNMTQKRSNGKCVLTRSQMNHVVFQMW